MKNNIKAGDELIIIRDTRAICMTYYAEPGFGEKEIVIPGGEKIKISNLDLNINGFICCDLVNYDKFHKEFVSEEERNHAHYGGYFLLVSLELIHDNAV